ncbi:hypothetical protein ABH920_005707 [Catenulispora sp. EB89]|uniref:hypothetical protein n=1 Tax=Catenulispora sp. EB89 TaxID=3156257 RepID=UPI0035147AAA
MDERDELIFVQINVIAATTGRYVVGVLKGDISREEQLRFADHLLDCAATIRDRARQTHGYDAEGGNSDEGNGRTSVGASDERHDQAAAGHD